MKELAMSADYRSFEMSYDDLRQRKSFPRIQQCRYVDSLGSYGIVNGYLHVCATIFEIEFRNIFGCFESLLLQQLYCRRVQG